jgi:hypothetical protein
VKPEPPSSAQALERLQARVAVLEKIVSMASGPQRAKAEKDLLSALVKLSELLNDDPDDGGEQCQ